MPGGRYGFLVVVAREGCLGSGDEDMDTDVVQESKVVWEG